MNKKNSIIILGIFVVFFSLIIINSVTLNDDLVSYYGVNENVSDKVNDSISNNDLNINAVGGFWNEGIINRSYYLQNGTGNFINGSFSGISKGNQNISIQMWVNLWSSANNNNNYFKFGNATLIQFAMSKNAGGNYQVEFSNNDGGSGSVNVQFAPGNWTQALDRWDHLIITYNSNGSVDMYVNGSHTAAQNISGVFMNIQNFYLGEGIGFGGIQLSASVDEISVWKRVLSASEVSELYNDGAGKNGVGGFGNAPSVQKNETIPTSPGLGNQSVYFNVSVRDTDNDRIESVLFWLQQPNGTILIDGVNGTKITGDNTAGQNETWNSTAWDINFLTAEVGTWLWNFTIVSNGTSLANTTQTGNFTVTDDIFPNVTIEHPLNNSIISSNLSLDLNFTTADSVEVDTIWFTTDEGLTNTTITGIYKEFNVLNGTINVTIYVNDSSNNINSSTIYNVTYEFDQTNPNNTIISPNGTVGTSTPEVNRTGNDNHKISSVFYNVTNEAGVIQISTREIENKTHETMPSLSDGSYIVFVFINDSTNNFNVTNQSFTITTAAAPSTGGGGGGGVTIIGGDRGWFMQVVEGESSFQKEMPLGASLRLLIEYENLDEDSKQITLSCENLVENACQYVEFPESPFKLQPGKDIITKNPFIINLPDDAKKTDYRFNIVAEDEDGNDDFITVDLAVETTLFVPTFRKITDFDFRLAGIPYFWWFLLSTIISGFLLSKAIPSKVRFRPSLILSIPPTISFFIIYLL